MIRTILQPTLLNVTWFEIVFCQVGVIEAELTKLNAEQLVTLKDQLNNLFAKCVSMLGHDHHIRVAHSLQVTRTAFYDFTRQLLFTNWLLIL